MLTSKIATPVLVVAQIGTGIPLYMFAGQDILDAVEQGYLSISNQRVWLTKKGSTAALVLMKTPSSSGLN